MTADSEVAAETANATSAAKTSDIIEVDVVVIGAGFAGMYMVYRLREAGFTVRAYEAGNDVGGTWFWNRYPGARCDSESMYYSYSFLTDLEQEWPIRERYPAQPDILRYLDRAAERMDVRKHFAFNTRIASIVREPDRHWVVGNHDGPLARAKWVVTAVGCLSAANNPDFPGADTFTGQSLHTGRWPHEGVDLTGKRVGIIGTGASGIQAIPVLAQQAAHLTVFQRTAQYTIPAANGPISPDFEEMWKTNYREWRRRARNSRGGFPYTASERSTFDLDPDERRVAYEAGWEQGGFMFSLGTFNDVLVDERANECAGDFVKAKIDEIVRDPRVAEMLKPTYPISTKRLALDTNYYETFNRPNVTLVDLRSTPIEAITPTGITTSCGQHDLDVIVYATGFDALTGPLTALGIVGPDGRSLGEVWAEGPVTYLGLAMAGLPNLFTITGPGSPSVLTNMPVAIEQHVEWIGDLLEWARAHDVDEIEATTDSCTQWTQHVQDVANKTLYPRAASWYMGANIPGKPRLFLPYTGGFSAYSDKCNDVAASGYSGFAVRNTAGAVAPTPTGVHVGAAQ